MLEIAIIIALTRKLFAITNERGSGAWWAGLGPVMWISGEIMGFLVAGMFGLTELPSYPVAIVFALAGAWLSHQIVREAPIQVVLPSDETEEALASRSGGSE